ncbi:phosphoribosyltransferase-like protein [Xanthomonas campestris]|uniref:phosphoribosyltransferase-like protein n=1 Tax=Xanthomonas campestris TaxID=339 RepID=UPI001C4066BA|nr:hypothetical protein [Xanthomonas campestris]MEB1153281.1 hypothetical protein [Xanthomonas campestris pv. campestris]MCC5099190.1 hypothetical protein [Xanthomonas campestris]MEA9585355.1 hypothetical protein [Xanthomonas campestris]MEA9593697.1 hypothetical protein [Xanthomonas campestris]MEA9625276.1 hypothetical protein [Xanthomonas campestris]
MREFDHVIRHSFVEKSDVVNFFDGLLSHKDLVGENPATYWAASNFLRIQQDGQSQKHMNSLLGERLKATFNLDIKKCGSINGEFIYLDDILFSGNRISSDLEKWIANEAPQKAVVQIVVIAFHTGGQYYLSSTRLKKAIASSGKEITIKFWRILEIQNQAYRKYTSDVLWPVSIPAIPEIQAYVASEERFPHQLRQPGGKTVFFSSEEGRHVLEQEFLIAGVKIRGKIANPKSVLRPLGFSMFGVGFGSLIATYRNCPNNCPLALWWGDPDANTGPFSWYPLLPRKTYTSAENVFGKLNDL